MSLRSKIKRTKLLDFDSNTCYQPGQNFYFPAATSPTELYYVTDYTNAGETPLTHPAKFSKKTANTSSGNAKTYTYTIDILINAGVPSLGITHNANIKNAQYIVFDDVLKKQVNDLVVVTPTIADPLNKFDCTPSYNVADKQLIVMIIGEIP